MYAATIQSQVVAAGHGDVFSPAAALALWRSSYGKVVGICSSSGDVFEVREMPRVDDWWYVVTCLVHRTSWLETGLVYRVRRIFHWEDEITAFVWKFT